MIRFFMGRRFRAAAVCAAAVCAASVCAVTSAHADDAGAAGPKSDREIWNEGVGYWRAGDTTNALATLRPLMLSRSHGARASEIVGAIQHARMRETAAEDPAAAAAAAEESAAAMQIALRGNPDDARTGRNFTRATDRVAELREAAHVKAVLEASKDKGLDSLLGAATRDARAALAAAGTVLTNEARTALAMSEAMAKDAQRIADVWIPVKEGIMREMAQSATNDQQLAAAANEVEAAREASKRAATALADMDPAAQTALAQAEDSLTRFWKMAVMPPAAVDESILAQTNAYIGAAAVNSRPWQKEALDFTRAFRARFPEWAANYEQQAAADTNMPPFTKEAQAEIAALAVEVEKLQSSCVAAEDPPSMTDALHKLERIRELLPKDKNGGGGQGAQNQDSKNEENGNPPPKQDEQPENQPQQPQQQPDGQDKEDSPKEQKDQGEPDDDRKPGDEEVEALLQKAKDRNDRHEEEKKARMRKVPLSPNERDW